MNDLKFAFRQLLKNPGFTAVAVLALALGIGACVAVFAFVDAALIKPLPYQDPGRLIAVYERTDTIPHSNLSYPDFRDWKADNRTLASLDVWTGSGYLLKTGEGARPTRSARVSAGFFQTLGIAPVLGRSFQEGDDLPGAPATVMLSHAAWRDWFDGSGDVIGKPAVLSGVTHTIIGVLPESFHFAPRGKADLWTPLQPVDGRELNRSFHNLYGVARLKDGVSPEAAEEDLAAIAKRLEDQYPDSNHGQGASVQPLAEAVMGSVRTPFLALLGCAGLLLLIGGVNVAGLLLVRTERRGREVAVRGALGASPGRLIRQFAVENLALTIVGGMLGLIAGVWAIQLLAALVPPEMLIRLPFLSDLGLNFRVVFFACALTIVVALAITGAPMSCLSWSNLSRGLAEGSRGSAGTTWKRLGGKLVVIELAVTMMLLTGAGLLGGSLHRLLRVDLGFQPDNLATIQVAAPDASYGDNTKAVALGREITSRVAGLPGVESVGIASLLPVTFNGNTDWIRFVGRPYDGGHIEVNQRDVSAGYLKTLQAKLVRGRYFTDTEDASQPRVAIVNRTFATRFFPNEDPLGKRFGDTSLSPGSIKEIVGVVEDIRDGSLDSEIWPTVFYPFNQDPDTYFAVVARVSPSAGSFIPTLVSTIHGIDPDLGTVDEATMIDRINDSPTAYLHRSSAWLVGGFAAAALLLGVVGLYGVIAYSVGQRTREIGIRIALGAQRGNVCRLILAEAGWLTAAGMLVGLAGSIGVATFLSKLLFETKPWDAPTLAAVSLVLGLASLIASYVPARRAARVDPMVALRSE